MAAAGVIPVGDAAIVPRGGGTRAAALGIHGAAAADMLAASAALLMARAPLDPRKISETGRNP